MSFKRHKITEAEINRKIEKNRDGGVFERVMLIVAAALISGWTLQWIFN